MHADALEGVFRGSVCFQREVRAACIISEIEGPPGCSQALPPRGCSAGWPGLCVPQVGCGGPGWCVPQGGRGGPGLAPSCYRGAR